jgi:E3 ubiquitin-protein ligase ZNF598
MGSGFANITSGRVLNAKQRAAQSSSRQVWDRVAQAASSSSSSYTPPPNARFVPGAAPPPPQPAKLPERFPPLNPAGPTPGVPRAAAGGQHKTAWSASASGGGAAPPAPSPAPRAPFSVPGPAAGKAKKGTGAPPPPVLSNSAFPTLPPSSGGPRVKPPASGNKSLRAIVGEPAPVANPWASGGSGGSGSNVLAGEREDEDETVVLQNGGGGKKKGKGKQKQTLFTLGTMPS